MKFITCGPSLYSLDTRIELQRLLPGLAALEYHLGDIATIGLCYGHPSGIEFSGDLVVRWDKTCDNDIVKDPRVKSIVFRTQSSLDNFELSNPNHSQKLFKCAGIADPSDPIKDAPPGIQSIRSQFDTLFLTASPEWCADDNLQDCISTYHSLKCSGSYGKTCLVIMGNNPTSKPKGLDFFYVNWLSEPDRLAMFSISSWLLNSSTRVEIPIEVIDSLSQGTPVMHRGQQDISHLVNNMGGHWKSPVKVQEYPWDLSAISPNEATKIFSSAFSSLE